MALFHSSLSVRNKGLCIILIWNFSAWTLLYSVVVHILEGKLKNNLRYIYNGIVGLIVLLCPIFGWIADTYWGRYKMIRRSLLLAWLATIAICLLSIIPDDLPHVHLIKEVSDITLVILSLFSLGGLVINIVQFGVDQLPDASSADITAFTNWYVWVGNVGYIVVTFSSNCVCSKYTAVAKLLLPACMTIALCLDYNFNHWLIKEPVSENPLKLIYRVMHYAWKNKYPRQRSAFTYYDDKRHSRIDFAKQKFGGPFTTEQVEDVKTFWRILFYLIILILYSGSIVKLLTVAENMRYHLHNWDSKPESNTQCSIRKCYQERSVFDIGYLMIAIVIPLHEFILHRLIGRLSSFTKFITGLFLALMSMIGYLFLEVAGHAKLHGNTTNATCLLEVDKNNPSTWSSLPLDYKWIMIPECLRSTGYFFMTTAGIQFIHAQSPYSMKGLVFGLAYECLGLSYIIFYIVLIPITYAPHKWPPTRYGCGTWYLLSASIILLLMFVLACILISKYKKRQRGDILPNEHIFAINYYSRYTMQNTITEDS